MRDDLASARQPTPLLITPAMQERGLRALRDIFGSLEASAYREEDIIPVLLEAVFPDTHAVPSVSAARVAEKASERDAERRQKLEVDVSSALSSRY